MLADRYIGGPKFNPALRSHRARPSISSSWRAYSRYHSCGTSSASSISTLWHLRRYTLTIPRPSISLEIHNRRNAPGMSNSDTRPARKPFKAESCSLSTSLRMTTSRISLLNHYRVISFINMRIHSLRRQGGVEISSHSLIPINSH